ncbi:LPXTG cell wall anchor domain-containing protein [Limosilactobacillus sp. Sa3CUN2]|uniref:LPXTG cell wall anchor domain-containing protein n=1 Tax=Limosilactobacillus avistercoris TaxID=2762243 RepID=A0ABR8PBK1_9LACO|nr:LPXTG cell wall anchor domain-containing protein [Limosilactobacillus avistercoris]MBD7894674.1 LPXTG cell wall anchor domain-containing protein [Limosilactobacillus avistercoris]
MYNKKSIIKQCVGITSATVLMTMAVTAGTSHAAKSDPSSITSGQQFNNQDEIRQITRTIKIDDPYKGMQTVKQTVIFKKVANQWQALTPNFWSSFFAPNYDDFEPSIVQVRAQPVTADDQEETITVTYHQYKIPERQRLVEFRHTFYGYDDNFKFNSITWNSKLVKVGQWYDFPPAPKGFEYCQPEVLPKRLKLYQTDQEPFRLLIQPIQKINEQVGDKHEEQLEDKEQPSKNIDKDKTSTDTQTNLITHNDNETQTEKNKDQNQQTDSPESRDGEVQTEKTGKDSGNQTMAPETSTHDSQTEEIKTKDQRNQTLKPEEKEGSTQTDSNTKDQITQTELTSHNNEETQTEGSTDQGQQTVSPESKNGEVQTEQIGKDGNSQTSDAEIKSEESQTEEPPSKDQESQTSKPEDKEDGTQTASNSKEQDIQTVDPVTKEDGAQTNSEGVDQTIQTELISHNDDQTQTEGSMDQGQQTDSPESKSGEVQTEQIGKDNTSQTIEAKAISDSAQTENTITGNHTTQTIMLVTKEDYSQTESNDVDQRTQTRLSLNDHSTQTDNLGGIDSSTPTDEVINHQEQIKSTKNENDDLPKSEDSQIEERIQDSESPNTTCFNHESLGMNDTSIQQLLDRDSTSLKELSNKKNGITKNMGRGKRLPQTGNQTDNKTTLIGIMITGLVSFLTMLSWKHREKTGKKAKKDLHF